MLAGKLFSALALTSLVSIFAAGCVAEVDEEEVDESGDRLLAGRRLTPSEIAGHLRDAGFPEEQIGRMVCTAKYESSFYERASNRNRNGSVDRGLFQINSIHLGTMRGCPSRRDADALNSAATNTACALAIFKAQGNRAWYGYRRHKTECDRYPAPPSADVLASHDADVSNVGSSALTEEDDGGCWSATLEDMLDARACVQSRSSRVWMQCMDGGWYRGGDDASGPFGPCSGSYRL